MDVPLTKPSCNSKYGRSQLGLAPLVRDGVQTKQTMWNPSTSPTAPFQRASGSSDGRRSGAGTYHYIRSNIHTYIHTYGLTCMPCLARSQRSSAAIADAIWMEYMPLHHRPARHGVAYSVQNERERQKTSPSN